MEAHSPSTPWGYRVSIIIPVFNQAAYTLECLSAIGRDTDPGIPYEMVVVDNGSTDETRDILAGLAGDCQVITNTENLGFARACNQGAREARGEHFLFLNNDTVVQPGWLGEMVKALESDPRVGIVGSKLVYPDGRLQHAGVVISFNWTLSHLYHGGDVAHQPFVNKMRDFKAVTGACLLLRRGIVNDEQVFDEAYVNGFEDVDLCFRVGEKGYRVVYCPSSVVIHHEGVSAGRTARDEENARRLRERWEKRIPEDESGYFRQDGFYQAGEFGVWQWCGFDPDTLRTGREGPPQVSVLVVGESRPGDLAKLIHGIGRYSSLPHEVVLVASEPDQETRSFLEIFAGRPGYHVIHTPAEADFAESVRRGLDQARARHVALVSSQAAPTPEWDRTLLAHLRPGIGAVGPLANVPSREQSVEPYLPSPSGPLTVERLAQVLRTRHMGLSRDVRHLEPFCLLLSRDRLREIMADLPRRGVSAPALAGEISSRLRARGCRLLVATDAYVFLRDMTPEAAALQPTCS